MEQTESKRQRFSRIFPARVTKIREQLRVLSNCANKSNYDYDQSKVNLFFAYILQEFITLAKLFGVEVKAEVNNKDVLNY
jgi:hypothetical protein